MLHYLLFPLVILAMIWGGTALLYGLTLAITGICQRIVYRRVKDAHRKTCSAHGPHVTLGCNTEIHKLTNTKVAKLMNWLKYNKWISYWPVSLVLVSIDSVRDFISDRINASAKRHIRYQQSSGLKELTVSSVGNGRFLWITRSTVLQKVNFKRLEQQGPFADIWYHAEGNTLTRDDQGLVLFTREETLKHGKEIIQNGSKTELPGYDAEALYGSFWTFYHHGGVTTFTLHAPLDVTQSVELSIGPGTSTVRQNWPEGGGIQDRVLNAELLVFLQQKMRQLENNIPEIHPQNIVSHT